MNLPCSFVQVAAVQLGSYLTRQHVEQQLWSGLRLLRPALQHSAGNVRDYYTKPHIREVFIQICCFNHLLRKVQNEREQKRPICTQGQLEDQKSQYKQAIN